MAGSDKTAGSFSVRARASATLRARVDSDEASQKEMGNKRSPRRGKGYHHHPLHPLALNHIHQIQKMRTRVRD